VPDRTRLSGDGSLDGSLGGRCGARRLARRRVLVRGGPGVLPDGLLVSLRRKGSVETGLVYCPTARSQRFGGWLGRDGPGVLPGGSLAALRRNGQIETGKASCPTVRSRCFGGCQTALLE